MRSQRVQFHLPGPSAVAPLVVLLLLVGSGSGAWLSGQETADDQRLRPAMSAELLQQVKAATVFVQVSGHSWLDDADDPDIEPRFQATGTGFIIAEHGRVVTNWHVIAAQQEDSGLVIPLRRTQLQVITHSGTPRQQAYPARVVAVDQAADLAILEFDPGDDELTTLSLGNQELRETTPVWLSGFPFGALFSVLQRGPAISINRGHVSSLRRDDRGDLQQIQFDAAVNRGNSGGALLGLDGRVYGVANIAMGSSRVNFAIPVHKLHDLVARLPASRVPEEVNISIASEPTGARVRLAGRDVGTTPLSTTVAGGYQRLSLALAGHRSPVGTFLMQGDDEFHQQLQTLIPSRLMVRRGLSPAPRQAAHPVAEELWREDFSDPAAVAQWDQDTGGSEHQRSWYAEDGVLHQFSDDDLLHAIFAGEKTWRDYRFHSRVRINRNRDDGRAGILVRANDDGFVLVRLHSGRNVIQVAQHVHQPFGWTILAERPLNVDTEQWYDMAIEVHGRRLLALVDDEPVIAARLPPGPMATAGRVGFYAVDARAGFADARVKALDAPEPVDDGEQPPLQGFWFNEPFAHEHGLWHSSIGHTPDAPWNFVPGALMQLSDGPGMRRNLLRRYELHDYQAHTVVSIASGAAGLQLRGDDQEGLLLLIDQRQEALRLLHWQGEDDYSELARSNLPARSGEGRYQLAVQIQGRQLRAAVDNRSVLSHDQLPLESGYLGLVSADGRAMFHLLGASSVQ